MALQIYIMYYGAVDPELVNTREYALKIAAGLKRLATGLEDEETTFLTKRDFPDGEPDNTWVSFSLVTENPAAEKALTPLAQCNVHFLMKHVADEDDFAGGLTAAGGLLEDTK